MHYLSSDANRNYVAEIITVDNLRKHSNADKLQVTTIGGSNIIVDMNTHLGDVVVFCPTESCLNVDFLRANNLFDNAALNADSTQRGYINNKGRIRAIKLRGEFSRACLLKLNDLKVWKPELDLSTFKVGDEFDMVCGEKFIEKYIPPAKGECLVSLKRRTSKSALIVDKQFNFHVNTADLARRLPRIKPDSIIQISHKLHGTAGTAACLLIGKKVGLFKKMLYKLLGEKPMQYGFIASSKTAIRDVSGETLFSGFYGHNIWKYTLNIFKPYLTKGMTIYYELVGFVPETGVPIQTGYDYGCAEKTCMPYIYRITHTNADGVVFELSTQQVRDWCSRHDFNAVPELYYGKASDFCPDVATEDVHAWQLAFYEKLKTSFYMERNDPLCKNIVPFEGVVVRVESPDIIVYREKTNAFFELETKRLDQGDIGMDDDSIVDAEQTVEEISSK